MEPTPRLLLLYDDRLETAGSKHSPDGGRRPMAEHRAPPGRKHRCHPTALRGQRTVADGVDTPVDHAQAPGVTPVIDRPVSQPGREELPPRDDSMLPLDQLGDQPLSALTTFGMYFMPNFMVGGHTGRMAAEV
jgi:hypothetical protein